jgi:hypothetical protein
MQNRKRIPSVPFHLGFPSTPPRTVLAACLFCLTSQRGKVNMQQSRKTRALLVTEKKRTQRPAGQEAAGLTPTEADPRCSLPALRVRDGRGRTHPHRQKLRLRTWVGWWAGAVR